MEKTNQEKQLEMINEKIKTFLKSAVTRSNTKFVIEHIDKNIQGIIISFSGYVNDKEKIKCYWNGNGACFNPQNANFDLVIKESAKDFLK